MKMWVVSIFHKHSFEPQFHGKFTLTVRSSRNFGESKSKAPTMCGEEQSAGVIFVGVVVAASESSGFRQSLRIRADADCVAAGC